MYEGEIKHFNDTITRSFVCYTQAVSKKQALSRCTFKVKVKFGFDKTAKLALNPNKLH